MESRPPVSSQILLVFPPQCKSALHGPHLAIPQLVGYLQSHGFEPSTRDLNIEFFRHITSPARMAEHLAQFARRRDALRERDVLSEEELGALLSLSQIDGLQQRLAQLRPDAFLDDDDFSRCLRFVDPLLEEMPINFDDVLAALDDRPANIINAYLDQLDLDRMCDGVAMVGISVAFHLQLYPALELARRIRERFGERITIALGGSQISLMTEEQKNTLARLGCVNAVVVHEGEVPLLTICQQLKAGNAIDFSQVPNTYYQDGDDVRPPTWHRPLVMGELPTPSFDDAQLALYFEPPVLPVYVSKGCYWGKCKFCDYTKLYTPGQAKTQAWAVFRPAEKLADDFAALKARHGISRFYLVSEAITPSYYVKLSKIVLERRLKIGMSSYCRVEKTYDFQFFQLLRDAGVHTLTFGVESTEDRILDLIDKGNTVADIRKTIRYARAAGIDVTFNLIPDYPTITWEEVERTVGFIRENIDFISRLNHQFFDLSANSPIAEEEEEHGLTVDRDRHIQTQHGIHSLAYTRKKGLSPTQLKRVRKLFNHLATDIAIYRRTRDLLNLTSSPHFDWNRASFMMPDDLTSFELSFDPAAPVETDGTMRFERLPRPVTILASSTVERFLSCSPAVSAIIETARTAGLFSVDDVLRAVARRWNLDSAEKYRNPIIQCLQSLLQEGFISTVFHPWQGAPSVNVTSVLAAEAAPRASARPATGNATAYAAKEI